MSVAEKIITCDKCDFSVDTLVACNGFFYELPHGGITIPKVLGWCHSCESFKPVEEGDLEKITEFFKSKLESLEKVLGKDLIFIVNMAKITNHFDELLEKTGLVTNESKNLKFKDIFYEKSEPTSFAKNFCSLFRNIPVDGSLEITEKIFNELSDKNLQFGIPKDGLPYFFDFINRVIEKYPFDFRLSFRLIIENRTEIGLKTDYLVPISHVLWLLSNLRGNSKLANYINCGSYKVTG